MALVLVVLAGLALSTWAMAQQFPAAPACDPAENAEVVAVTNVSINGGIAQIIGNGFEPGFQAWIPPMLPTAAPTYMQTISFDDKSALVQVPPLDAGTYAILVNDQSCSQNSYANAISVVATPNPSSILGGDLKGWYIAKHAICSGSCGTPPYFGNCPNGGMITSFCDETGNGNHIACVADAGPQILNADPAYQIPTTTSALFNGGLDAGATYCSNATITLGSGKSIFLGGSFDYQDTRARYAAEMTSGEGSPILHWVPIISGDNYQLNSASPQATTVNTSPIGTPAIWVSGYDVVGQSPTATMNNGALYVGPDAGISSIGSTYVFFSMGADSSGSLPALVSTPEFFIPDRQLTQTELNEIAVWENTQYGTVPPPTLTDTTIMVANTANAPLRISGTGFQLGMTAAVNGALCTTVDNTLTVAEVECPSTAPGLYNLRLANPDGNSNTYVSTVDVTTDVSAWSIFGFAVQGDYEGSAVCAGGTCATGDPVQTWVDLSQQNVLGLYQATSLEQPIWTAADPGFGGQPTITGDGVEQFLSNNAYNVAGPASSVYMLVVGESHDTTHTIGAAHYSSGVAPFYQLGWASGVPTEFCGSSRSVAWGSFLPDASALVGGGTPSLASCEISVGNGTAVYVDSGTTAAFATPGTAGAIGSQIDDLYSHVTLAAVVFLNTIPTSGQRTAWESYAQGKWGVP